MWCDDRILYVSLTIGQRNFKTITTIGFTTCVMGTWEILLTYDSSGPLNRAWDGWLMP